MNYIKLPENIETKVFVLDSGAVTETANVLKQHFTGKTVQIVADENTFRVAGCDVLTLCKNADLPCAAGCRMRVPLCIASSIWCE